MPSSDDQREIWRYMDFESFVAFVTHREFWLPSVAALQATDPFERYDPTLHEVVRSLANDGEAEEFNLAKAMALGMRGMEAEECRRRYVSCWHLSQHESIGMWAQYVGRHRTGVAIQSSVGCISELLECGLREFTEAAVSEPYRSRCRVRSVFRVHANEVSYGPPVDASDQYRRRIEHGLHEVGKVVPDVDFRKRAIFAYEQEFRFLAVSADHRIPESRHCSPEPEEYLRGTPIHLDPRFAAGIAVPMTFASAAHRVVVSPAMPDWQRRLARTLAGDVPVEASQAELHPVGLR